MTDRFDVRFQPDGHLSGWQIVDTASDNWITHAYAEDADEEAAAREVCAVMNTLPTEQQNVLWGKPGG